MSKEETMQATTGQDQAASVDLKVELRGLKFLDGHIVQVGKATQQMCGDSVLWICETQPPLEQRFLGVEDRREAIQWLREVCGAEEVLEGRGVA